MTDIFISYTEENQHQAQLLSQALEQQGFSVWWNKDAPAGQLFNSQADEALQEAKCVVVIWSQFSVSDRWINSVAKEASEKGNLLPALFEDVFVPVEFRDIQTANLIGWTGETSDTFFQDMVIEINKHIQSINEPADMDPPLGSALMGKAPEPLDPITEEEEIEPIAAPNDPISEEEKITAEDVELENIESGSVVKEETKSYDEEAITTEDNIVDQESTLEEELRTSSEGDSPIEELIKGVDQETDGPVEMPLEEPTTGLDPTGENEVSGSVEVIKELEEEYHETGPLADYETQVENQDHYVGPEMEHNETSKKANQPKLLLYGGLIAAVLVILWGIFQVIPDNKEPVNQVQTLDVSPQLPAANPPPKSTAVPIEVSESAEGLDWKTALAENDLAAYETYQKNYPKGKHLIEAKEKIAALQSEAAAKVKVEPAPSERVVTTVAPSNPKSEGYATVKEGNFFTTKTLTRGPMRPGEPSQDFQAGERVYLWATINTPAYERVKLEWLTSEDRLITDKYVNIAKDLGNGFNIHDWKQNFPGTRGQFKVRLFNSNNEKIAETTFRIN